MDWIDALRDRGGPLPDAARGFLRAHDLTTLPRGGEGVVELAKLLDRSEHLDDDSCIEGAGALLGLLLVDHVGDGGHVAREKAHRVRLGRFGFVDPFAAIAHALDAEEPRKALARAIREAEEEADGEGPTSRVLSTLEAMLEARGGPAIAWSFEALVGLDDGVELDLARVVSATRGEPQSAVALALHKMLAMVPSAGGAAVVSDAQLLPRLVGDAFFAKLGSGAEGLFSRRLAPSLHLALTAISDGRARYLRSGEIEERAIRVAIENLATRSTNARFARVELEEGPFVVARSSDGLDAARLVLPGLRSVLAAEIGDRCLVAAPHRDTLIACSAVGSERLVAAVRERVEDAYRRAPHAISKELFPLDEIAVRLDG